MSEITRLFNNVKRAKPLDGTSAFGGNASRKATAVALAAAHRAADDFIQGTFWEEGAVCDQDWTGLKGCAVGCLTHTSDDPHQRLGDYYGIPRTLAHLADDVFEALSEDDCKDFPLAFMQAIPVGADLRPVAAKLYLLIAKLNFSSQDDLTRAYHAYIPQRVIAETPELKRDAPFLRDELLRLVASA